MEENALQNAPINAKKASKMRQRIIQVLRRLSYMYGPRNEALRASRVGRNQYKCAITGQILSHKEVKIDHIEPVVPISGFDTWDGFIKRLFCSVEGFQIISKVEHDKKTKKENWMRKNYDKVRIFPISLKEINIPLHSLILKKLEKMYKKYLIERSIKRGIKNIKENKVYDKNQKKCKSIFK